MSYGNNTTSDEYNTSTRPTGFGSDQGAQFGEDTTQQRRGQGQANMGTVDPHMGGDFNQGQGQRQQDTSNMYGSTGDEQFLSSDRGQSGDPFGTSGGGGGRDTFGSSGGESYGTGTGMGTGVGATARDRGGQTEMGQSGMGQTGMGQGGMGQSGMGQTGMGQTGMAGGQGQQRASFGEKMRGGIEKAAGKVTQNPDLTERGEERKTGQYDASSGQSY